MARKQREYDPAIKQVTRLVGDDAIVAGREAQSGVEWVIVSRRPHPFALNWRGILRGVLILSVILLALPGIFWLISRLHEASTRLPSAWQPYIGLLWAGLAVYVVILAYLVHLIHLVLTGFHALRELSGRAADWARRRREKRDPKAFEQAYDDALAELQRDTK